MMRRAAPRYLANVATVPVRAREIPAEAIETRSPQFVGGRQTRRRRAGASLGRRGDDHDDDDDDDGAEIGDEQEPPEAKDGEQPMGRTACVPGPPQDIPAPAPTLPASPAPPELPVPSTEALGAPTSALIASPVPPTVPSSPSSALVVDPTSVVMATVSVTSTTVATRWLTTTVIASPTLIITSSSSDLAASQSTASPVTNPALTEMQTSTPSLVSTSSDEFTPSSTISTTESPASSTATTSETSAPSTPYSTIPEQQVSTSATTIPTSFEDVTPSPTSTMATSSSTTTGTLAFETEGLGTTESLTKASPLSKGVGTALAVLAATGGMIALIAVVLVLVRRYKLIERFKNGRSGDDAPHNEKAHAGGVFNFSQQGRPSPDNDGRIWLAPSTPGQETQASTPTHELYVPPSMPRSEAHTPRSPYAPPMGSNRPQEARMDDNFQLQYEEILPTPPLRIPVQPQTQNVNQDLYSASTYSGTTMNVVPQTRGDYEPNIPQGAHVDDRYLPHDIRPLPPLPSSWSVSRQSNMTVSTVPRFRDIGSWASDQRMRAEGSEVLPPLPLDAPPGMI